MRLLAFVLLIMRLLAFVLLGGCTTEPIRPELPRAPASNTCDLDTWVEVCLKDGVTIRRCIGKEVQQWPCSMVCDGGRIPAVYKCRTDPKTHAGTCDCTGEP